MAGAPRPPSSLDKDELVAELGRLRHEVLQLRQTNARLSGQTNVLKEGVLMRYREQLLSQNWRERFFDLRVDGSGAILRCFRQDRRSTSGPGELRMSINLDSSCKLLREAVPLDSQIHCFQLQLPPPRSGLVAARDTTPIEGGMLRLGAATAEEADLWIEAFEAACFGLAEADVTGNIKRRPSLIVPPGLAKGRQVSVLRIVHKETRSAVLTSDGGLPDCSLVGIMNLSVVVMVAMHFRLLVENLMKYGILLAPWSAAVSLFSSRGGHCVVCFLGLPCFALAILLTEVMASKGHIAVPAASATHGFICTLCLAVPIAVIRQTKGSPSVGALLIFSATILFLKLVSYAHVNTALRIRWRETESAEASEPNKDGIDDSEGQELCKYPDNLTVRDLCRFIMFPTLVYQLNYPRTERVRKKWLAKRVLELVVCMSLMFIMTEQFVVPTLNNAVAPIRELHFMKLLERLLKLAVPNVYLWLCMFYALFHLWLNILAEVTCFGDRLFYKEWWNATNLEDYWRLWNLPVHNWLLKHVFFPAINSGIGKSGAVSIVFFVSAAFHELLVSVPCHTFRLWAFFGMMGQLPLIKLTALIERRLKGSQLGNVFFWLSFVIVGQPLCVLLYFADSLGN